MDSWQTPRSLPEAVSDVSSAYSLVEKYIEDWGKSLINMRNNRGPTIDP